VLSLILELFLAVEWSSDLQLTCFLYLSYLIYLVSYIDALSGFLRGLSTSFMVLSKLADIWAVAQETAVKKKLKNIP
jgi:hypothetical protein